MLAKHGKFPPTKIAEMYLKRALFLEDEGNFASAERAFVMADKPKEAIDMWAHCGDWQAAVRVATETGTCLDLPFQIPPTI